MPWQVRRNNPRFLLFELSGLKTDRPYALKWRTRDSFYCGQDIHVFCFSDIFSVSGLARERRKVQEPPPIFLQEDAP